MPTNAPSDLTSNLADWLWQAACAIRGPVDAPKYKDYILPLIFLKRLSDVFDDEVQRLAGEFGGQDTAQELVERDHALVRFYVPPEARWDAIRRQSANLGEYLTDAMRATGRENAQRLQGVLEGIDFNATTAGQRILDDDRLAALIDVLSRKRLGLRDVEPDVLGRAYEHLLTKFAEGSGSSAGEFFTPTAVGLLMARLLDPQPGMTVYDPCCGSGGLLIKSQLRLIETHGEPHNGGRRLPPHLARLALHGQEINPDIYRLARMNTVIHDMEADIRWGDTMRNPAHTAADGSLRRYDLVAANPMWNQDTAAATYQEDPWNRFELGAPPSSSGDWGWIQHMWASLKEGGRMAVVLDTGAVSRGSGSRGRNKERDLRQAYVERDRIASVILLPENLFVNTSAPGIIMVLDQAKAHPGEILLINASDLHAKGRPKNYVAEEQIAQIHRLYQAWEDSEGLAAVITNEEAARADYNLSPSRHVARDDGEEVLSLEDAMVLLTEADEERAQADAALRQVLAELGLETGQTE